MDAQTFPKTEKMFFNINWAIWEMNTALENSNVKLVIVNDGIFEVSTGCGGVGQASRHVVGVFLRGRSDVAIVL